MRACYFSRHRGPLQVGEVALPPPPSRGHVIVRVRASSLNPADYKSLDGEQMLLLDFKWPRIPGFDFSGEVTQVFPNDDSHTLVVGDQVFGMIANVPDLHSGTCAEYILVEAHLCARKPNEITHFDAASIPLVAITAVKAFRACGLSENTEGSQPRVLVVGGAGGVGTAAIQIAKVMFRASFVATTGSGTKKDLLLSLGADQFVDYRTQPFENVLGSADQSKLFDAILDCTGEANRCVRLVRNGGALVSIVTAPTIDGLREWVESSRISADRVTRGVRSFLMSGIGGSILELLSGARSLRNQCAARGATYHSIIGCGDGQIVSDIAKLMATGQIRSVIQKVYPLDQTPEAEQELRRGRVTGKLVISIE